jgi:hypothetical protein
MLPTKPLAPNDVADVADFRAIIKTITLIQNQNVFSYKTLETIVFILSKTSAPFLPSRSLARRRGSFREFCPKPLVSACTVKIREIPNKTANFRFVSNLHSLCPKNVSWARVSFSLAAP